MRIVIALGGNALLKRGEPMTAEVQRENARTAARLIAPLAAGHEIVISHGNGPQVGLLALQAACYRGVEPYPLDLLDAQTEGMIGYMIEQELSNHLSPPRPCATVLTMVEVDPADPAFLHPTKFVGPGYDTAEMEQVSREKGWTFARDGDTWRRVVPSPDPHRIIEIVPIRLLLSHGVIVICAGGGGIPVVPAQAGSGRSLGVEAVIDKDLASALLAREVSADLLIMATDVDGVYLEWNTPRAHRIDSATPHHLREYTFAPGSMGPKVEAACRFVEATGKRAAIGALTAISGLVAGTGGTQVRGREDAS
ncbi:MAG: carbamate kinase [Methanolinea sp.]|nr:carbamate kinase [Methanolinea sp.]